MSEMAMADWKEDILKKWGRKLKGATHCITDDIRDQLLTQTKGEILFDEPMAKHTTMRVGGKADVFIKPATLADLSVAVQLAKQHDIPWMIFGWGSNTLVRDAGIRGFVISTEDCLTKIKLSVVDEDVCDVYAEAGAGISAFVNFCKEHSLTGCESLIGIPGSMGGAVIMNAGARGIEMKDIIREITVIDDEGNLKKISREKLDFSYRHLKIPKSWVVVSLVARLEKGQSEEINAQVREYQKKRVETQPLNYPNVGSVFKNPVAIKKGINLPKAGQLIEEAGLKNIRVGGARVSEKHANFIINENNAKARDVEVLIGLIRDRVREATGITLETEVKIIGEKA